MGSVGSATGVTFDGEVTTDDYDPMFALLNVLADVSLDFVDWHGETTDFFTTSGDMVNWISEAAATGRNISDENHGELVAFTSWMETIGFDFQKYFSSTNYVDINGPGVKVTSIRSKYKVSEVLELLGIEVDTISTNTQQVALFTEAITGDYSDVVDEIVNLIDGARDSARGHIAL